MISEKNGKIISVKRKKKLKFKQNIILIISKVRRKVKKSCKGKEKVKSKVKKIKNRVKKSKSYPYICLSILISLT